MSGVNKVIIIGRLGQDPELKSTPMGASVCNFTMATSESWKDSDGNKKENTQWHRIVTWGKTAELANQYLSKGRMAYIEGRLQTRSWEDSDGVKRFTTEINAINVVFLGSSGGSKNYTGEITTQDTTNSLDTRSDVITNEYIPF